MTMWHFRCGLERFSNFYVAFLASFKVAFFDEKAT